MRGIEPPLQAWEARVLPLNYIRGGLEVTNRSFLSQKRAQSPDGHQDTDHQKESDPAGPVIARHTGGSLAGSMFAPRQQIANDQRQAEASDHLGHQAVEPQNVSHGS